MVVCRFYRSKAIGNNINSKRGFFLWGFWKSLVSNSQPGLSLCILCVLNAASILLFTMLIFFWSIAVAQAYLLEGSWSYLMEINLKSLKMLILQRYMNTTSLGIWDELYNRWWKNQGIMQTFIENLCQLALTYHFSCCAFFKLFPVV